MTLHDTEELDDDLRGRTNEDLALATALGVDDVVLIGCKQFVACAGYAYSPGNR